jgi:hypothetical protein
MPLRQLSQFTEVATIHITKLSQSYSTSLLSITSLTPIGRQNVLVAQLLAVEMRAVASGSFSYRPSESCRFTQRRHLTFHCL